MKKLITIIYLTLFSAGCSTVDLSSSAHTANSLTRNDDKVGQLLAQMTLEEKIGQMTQAEQSGLKGLDDIEKYYLGSLFCGGNSDPKTGNGLKDWTDMYDEQQTRALKTRLAIPLL